MEQMAQFFKVLGDSTRVRLLLRLADSEQCVSQLAEGLGLSGSAVSHHLRLLRSSHLLVSRREGKEVYYRAADTAQAQAMHHMIEEMMEISCPQGRGEEDRG